MAQWHWLHWAPIYLHLCTMTDMAVIVPTRGRPASIRRLIEGWALTNATSTLVLGVDEDDESLNLGMVNSFSQEFGVDVKLVSYPRTSMNGTLNAIAVEAADEFDILAFMGDDHLPRTNRWDYHIRNALGDGAAMAYGNDLMQGILLPTAVFMSSSIVQALGYMAPPLLYHLFLDNAWIEWGKAFGGLKYLPDVVIEHLHPQAGKADWDEGHIRVNSGEMWEHDRTAFDDYVKSDLESDLNKLRAI
jgi:hypothetical protein